MRVYKSPCEERTTEEAIAHVHVVGNDHKNDYPKG